MSGPIATAPNTDTRGFTPNDLAALDRFRGAAIARAQWSRAEFVFDGFADYLAAWHAEAGDGEAPSLAIARFKRTGTYALTIGQAVVATAPRLDGVLAAVPARPHDAAMAQATA